MPVQTSIELKEEALLSVVNDRRSNVRYANNKVPTGTCDRCNVLSVFVDRVLALTVPNVWMFKWMSRLQTSCLFSFVLLKVQLCQEHNNGICYLFFGFASRFHAQLTDRLNAGKLRDAGKWYYGWLIWYSELNTSMGSANHKCHLVFKTTARYNSWKTHRCGT